MQWERLHGVLVERDTDMRNIKSILRYLRGNPGIMTVQTMSFIVEAVRRAPEGSALTCGNAVWAGDADRFSASGTASWAKDRLCWYPPL